MKKSFLSGALTVVALVLIVALGHQNIDVETLRIWFANADTWREERLVTLAVAFLATYVMVTALSLLFAVNLLMGLTPIRVVTFCLMSQLGMLAGEWRRAHANSRVLALVKRFHDWRRG